MSKIGIVIAAHGELGSALVDTARLIVGDTHPLGVVNLDPTMNLESMVEQLREAVEDSISGDGALLLLDLFGGTPCNAAALLMQDLPCLAITGINLPMLLEVVMQRENVQSLEELAELAESAGGSGIVDVKARFDALTSAE